MIRQTEMALQIRRPSFNFECQTNRSFQEYVKEFKFSYLIWMCTLDP